MATKVIMPQLGESVVEGTITKWLFKEGDPIQELDALLEVNTDKVDTEIPAPAGGVVLKLLYPEGTTLHAGTVIAWIGKPGEAVPGEAGPSGEHAVQAAPAAAAIPAAALTTSGQPGRSRELGFISPVVARLAGENNLDLALVNGTGEGGRITKKDVLAYLEAQKKTAAEAEKPAWETPGEGDLFRPTELMFGDNPLPPSSATPPAPKTPIAPSAALPTPPPSTQPGDVLVPLTPVRKAIAEHMVFSKQTSPHVTTVMEANMQRVLAHRDLNKPLFERDGVRLTLTAYFMMALVAALKAVPQANSSWTEQGILLHKAIHLGMAVSLGAEGLIVPVIKHADGLSLLGMARAVNDLAERARAHRLQPDEVKGGTFTLTNHGTGRSLFATPVINQPQCGILGAGMLQKRAVVIDDAIAIRPMVYLSFTFDHRILDGSSADTFLAHVVDYLEKI